MTFNYHMTEFEWLKAVNFFKLIMEGCALNNLLCYYTENDVSTEVRGRRYD